MQTSRGKFITFEGIDGSGKTTQLELLQHSLEQRRLRVTRAREPGGTEVGDAIRRILLDSATVHLSPVAEVLLYFASRAQNVDQVIEPSLAEGRVVLCDRFVDASEAYQGCGRGLGLDVIFSLERIACRGLKPDITFLLDIGPRTAVTRALERNRGAQAAGAVDESRFEREGLEFFTRVRQAYLGIARREALRVVVIDGERSIEAIQEDIWQRVAPLLGTIHHEDTKDSKFTK